MAIKRVVGSTISGSFMAMVITDVWKTAHICSLLAGLQVIDEGLLWEQQIDGANVFLIMKPSPAGSIAVQNSSAF